MIIAWYPELFRDDKLFDDYEKFLVLDYQRFRAAIDRSHRDDCNWILL